MIAYIKGQITYKSRTDLIVECNGMGYRIHISLHTYNQIASKDTVQLHTHFVVKEDSQTLYGFAEEQERKIFELLISVSGVGPNTARILLSTLSPAEVQQAIVAENVAVLKGAKGIGPKSAKRIILELKDKVLKESGVESMQIAQQQAQVAQQDNAIRTEALAALVTLGFNKIKVQKVLNKLLKEDNTIDDSGELIKKALGALA